MDPRMELNGEIMSDIGAAVKYNRARFGWSQEQLGRQAGLTGSYISMVEHGTRSLSLQSLEKLSAAFNISAAGLLGEATNASKKLELALTLREIAESENPEHLREIIAFAQKLAKNRER